MPVAAPTLPIPPGAGINVGNGVAETARVRKAPFGDGYMQRSRDGKNNVVGTYTVSFDNLTQAEAVALRKWFKDRGGVDPFYFTPPGEDAPRLWTCAQWNRTHSGPAHDTVSATFEEQFDP